ncbi:hypothetical protein [Cryptosporangium aurantiacum]|uniref:Uncharacterized protein n=1 Tax=Cryptosporangium aurantiacum TaxID=134849 RepID=A0A1M7RPP7_9ACTN|nr:hypothetical protein [Cryptosporangium aurantiacum]SHN48131.1 hypothetical protein SAMN05443668_13428 [Cryptosporangium aurantiacum]
MLQRVVHIVRAGGTTRVVERSVVGSRSRSRDQRGGRSARTAGGEHADRW